MPFLKHRHELPLSAPWNGLILVLPNLISIDIPPLLGCCLVVLPCLHRSAIIDTTILPDIGPIISIYLNIDVVTGSIAIVASRLAISRCTRCQESNS